MRVALLSVALLLAGWWWGSARLDAIDSSVLRRHGRRGAPAAVVVTGPARGGEFELRVPARLTRFGALTLREPVLLDLPVGRSPPQGALIALHARLRLPRPASNGFDERTWLRRHGVHVVVRGRDWRIVGHRGGIGGYADRVRAWLARALAPGLTGERRAVLEGIVLGEDEGLTPELRDELPGIRALPPARGQRPERDLRRRRRARPRVAARAAALARRARRARPGSASYVLAVGAQPSVIRAGIAGALGSLAWLSARQRDRWHFLLVGALVLLAWSPYNLLDAGFQLSFAAVVAIFVAVPHANDFLEGYPLPPRLPARRSRCRSRAGSRPRRSSGSQFGRIPLYSVPANALAAPVVAPLLGLSFAAAIAASVSPAAAALIAHGERLARRLPRLVRTVGRRPPGRDGLVVRRRRTSAPAGQSPRPPGRRAT